MSTIPASQLVTVNPSVITAGGNAVDAIGLVLTHNAQVPVGAVQAFASAAEVSSYFGPSSQESSLADVYFAGFEGSNVKPGSMLFAQYPAEAVAAYLRGGPISALTVAELQALSGSLSVTFDGYARPAASVDLAASTSFSAAAGIIEAALNVAAPNEASITGSIAGTTLTVTAMLSGTLGEGQTISGTGAGIVAAGTYIVEQLTGSVGGTGTYMLSVSGTVGSQTLNADATDVAVTYDSVAGAFKITSGVVGAISTASFATGTLAASILLTSATGAVLSQGADVSTPADFMDGVVAINSSWITFMTAFDPDDGVGISQKQAFAAWKDTQNSRFGYVCWDTDASPTTSSDAAGSLGRVLPTIDDTGTCLLNGQAAAGWDATTGPLLAAFICGAAASIDFEQVNGRITFAFKSQSGFAASVTDGDVATNLLANGYNFYGAYGAANAGYVWFQNGSCTGPFAWFDSFVNQIWLNTSFQIALLTLLQNSKSVPYNVAGRALIEAALADVIQAGLNFGAFSPGTISTSQQSAVNTQAGADVAVTLQTQGYYLQVLDASAAVRAARASPPCTFWYLDRGSVQKINLGSVAVQ